MSLFFAPPSYFFRQVSNIVSGNLSRFEAIYFPLIDQGRVPGLTRLTEEGEKQEGQKQDLENGWIQWQGSNENLEQLKQCLPLSIRPSPFPAENPLLHQVGNNLAEAKGGNEVAAKLAQVVKVSATVQSAKGIWTAGITKSLIYVAAKVGKFQKSMKTKTA